MWVLIRDNDDGELRIVTFTLVSNYLQNTDVTGNWEVVMRDKPLDELRAYCRLVMGGEHERVHNAKDTWVFSEP